MIRARHIIFLILPLLAAAAAPAQATAEAPSQRHSCSTFLLPAGGAFYVSHNLDEYYNVPGAVVVNKRGVRKESISWEDDLSTVFGKSRNAPRVRWTSKYGSITYNIQGKEFIDGGMNEAGVFQRISSFDDDRLAEIFAREVLSFLVGRKILSPDWAERILSWRHTGFNVHSLVRTKTKPEAERVGNYMIRPLLSLDRLSFLEPEGKIGYRWGRGGAEQERMDYLEFIARATSPIPDKGQVMVRYYGLYPNAHRGKVKKARISSSSSGSGQDKPAAAARFRYSPTLLRATWRLWPICRVDSPIAFIRTISRILHTFSLSAGIRVSSLLE